MIESWRDAWLREFFVNDTYSKELPSELRDRVFRKLQMIDDATCDADLRVPPSNRFERLSGRLEGFRSIRVNERWRLIFKWDGSDVRDIYLDDHSYR
ncbi:type II toxin-antitoxin system RelE/ParE family toxin [Granulicella sp. 5B5]|uniref:type II toxin-antitoxin system RelE/ParE family toxin n=1 Tax=Granulicella sp. 5B5 TaxID=1617967 RepID=UPI0015F73859|nr:type II toxin-antitoxin system RelE/ParE family toxin [Granulicella sp. 5B5]QMV19337.1 type II toxin-antitoxin system RelE/ParE family toxin [Granulicella sp. 5B5]